MSEAAKQGTGDGLCGIYCLINFMRGWFESDSTENDRKSFLYIMRAAEKLDIFTADKLHGGYEEAELRDIFDSVAATRSKNFRACLVLLTNKGESIEKRHAKLREIFAAGGQAILAIHGREHWVLTNKFWGSNWVQIIDPCPLTPRARIKIADIPEPFTALALLPLGSKLLDARS